MTPDTNKNVYVARLGADGDTLAIGIPSTFANPHGMIEATMESARLLPKKSLDALRYVEYFIMDNVPGVETFDMWKAAHPSLVNGDRGRPAHMLYLKSLFETGASVQMDQAWDAMKFGEAVYTRAILVSAQHEEPFVPKCG